MPHLCQNLTVARIFNRKIFEALHGAVPGPVDFVIQINDFCMFNGMVISVQNDEKFLALFKCLIHK